MLKQGPFRILVAMALISLSVSGCGDESNPAASTGPTGGANLANAPITSTNSAAVFSVAHAAVVNAISAVSERAARKPVVPAPLGKGFSGVSVNGKNAGKVTASGDYNPGSTEVSMTSRIVLENYSDDGKVFIGGALDITYKVPISNMQALTLTYKGDLSFSGDYKGSMTFDIGFSGGKASGSYGTGSQTVRL